MTRLMQAAYSNSSLSIPVKRSQYLYAQFRNLRGIPAGNNVEGVSVAKLRVIDTLLGRLKDRVSSGSGADFKDMDGNQLSAVIRELSARLHENVGSKAAAPTSAYKSAGRSAVSGLVVNLLA